MGTAQLEEAARAVIAAAVAVVAGPSLDRVEYRAITLGQANALFEEEIENRADAQGNLPGWYEGRNKDGSSNQNKDGTWKVKQACHKDTINLYDFMHWCIKPKCAEKKCSYVQLVADEPQKPAWFVSHWWGEPVRDFVRCLNEHARVRALSSHTAYWVCAYLSC